MEEKLLFVLQKYIKEVKAVCSIVIRGINDSECLNLKNKYDFYIYRAKCKKMEFEAEGISYRLHGKGCMAFHESKLLKYPTVKPNLV